MPSRRFWIMTGILVAGAGATAVAAYAYRGSHHHGYHHEGYGMGGEGPDWGMRGERRSWWRRGSITKDDFDARTRSKFARMDANSDGTVDQAEAKALIERRMERRGKRRAKRMERFAERVIKRFDVDKDGKVTREEVDSRIKERFQRADLDGDGTITDADLPPMLRDRDILSGKGHVGRRHGRRGARMLRFLRDADANGDGQISFEEAMAAGGKRFARFDRNKDGAVDKSDLDLLRNEIVDYRVKRFMHRFGAAQDGTLTKEQFTKFRNERFARYDYNNDGELSRDEMPGVTVASGGAGRSGAAIMVVIIDAGTTKTGARMAASRRRKAAGCSDRLAGWLQTMTMPALKSAVGPHNWSSAAAGAMSNDEAALLAEAGAGDAPAFRVLVDRHLPSVHRAARRMLSDEAEAEDVAQETMLRLWRTAASLKIGDGGVGPWLRRVASNLAIDRLRARRRLEVTDEVPEQGSRPTQLAGLAEQDVAARVETALRELPDRQRLALTLFHYEGMSQREVADVLDVSEDALESLLARARRRLRGSLEGEWRDLLQAVELE